jgi:hypothetical protein
LYLKAITSFINVLYKASILKYPKAFLPYILGWVFIYFAISSFNGASYINENIITCLTVSGVFVVIADYFNLQAEHTRELLKTSKIKELQDIWTGKLNLQIKCNRIFIYLALFSILLLPFIFNWSFSFVVKLMSWNIPVETLIKRINDGSAFIGLGSVLIFIGKKRAFKGKIESVKEFEKQSNTKNRKKSIK